MSDASPPISAPRISHAAASTGHDVTALLAHLTDVAKPLRDVAIHTNADVDSIGISIALPDDQWLARRMANLANAISASPALARVAMSRKGNLRAERGIGRQGRPARGLLGVFSALTITGPATLAGDLAAADAAGIPADARATLASRLRTLTGDDDGTRDRLVRTLVYSGPEQDHTTVELGAVADPDLVARAAAAASSLGLTSDDVRHLRAIHSVVGDVPALATVSATTSAPLPGFTLTVLDVSLDSVLALAGQFSDQGVQKMQPFLAGLHARTVDMLDITFGARPLGALWLTVRL